MFPEEFIALSHELQYHPQLMEFVAKHKPDQFEMRMMEIAAYCGIEVDGEFDEEDFKVLAHGCLMILQRRRTGIIIDSGTGV